MQAALTTAQEQKRILGWIGVACWLLIILAKVARHFHLGINQTAFGIAPSLLGPAGLLFVIQSSDHRRLAHLTLSQATLMAGAIAFALEFAQLLPRPGPLALVRYTFDWMDVAATLVSLSVGALASAVLRRHHHRPSS